MNDILTEELKSLESRVLDSLKENESSILKRAQARSKSKSELRLSWRKSKSLSVDTSASPDFKDGDTWHNWAGNIKFKPDKVFYPNNVKDLVSYVKSAQKDGKKIRCAAEGHTWSSLSVTNDYLVILNHMNKVTVEKRKNGYVVQAEAGAEISKLDKVLENHNPPLAISSMTVLDNVRIGGVVATGCHGAKTESRTIVDQVVGLEIVTANGDIVEFSDEKNREEMEAARVSLGLLGIISKVSLRVEPMYDLRMIDTYPLKSSFSAADIKELVENSDGIEIFYWPFNSLSKDTEKLWIKRWIRDTREPTVTDLQNTFLRIAQNVSTKIANDLYHHIIKSPELTPIITNFAGKVKLVERDDVWKAPEAIHYQAGIDNIPCNDMEFAIKADKDFTNVFTEIDYIFNRIFEYKEKDQYPINLAVELRILKGSSATLSSAYDKDPEAIYFFPEVLSVVDTQHYQEFTIELAQRWMEKYNAMPHWAKSWEHIPNITEYVRNQLGERIDKFESIRKKYDPNNMFFDNESLKRIFYGTN